MKRNSIEDEDHPKKVWQTSQLERRMIETVPSLGKEYLGCNERKMNRIESDEDTSHRMKKVKKPLKHLYTTGVRGLVK
jgi:hypothetical protein